MKPQFVKRFVTFLLISGGIVLWLALLFSGEWRDWADSDSWQNVTTRDFSFQPKSSSIRYRYAVNDQEYEGDRSHFFVLAKFQDDRVLDWIVENRQVNELIVYYDPDPPGRSVLVRELDSQWFWQYPLICGIAGLAILLPLLFFGTLWRWLRQQFTG